MATCQHNHIYPSVCPPDPVLSSQPSEPMAGESQRIYAKFSIRSTSLVEAPPRCTKLRGVGALKKEEIISFKDICYIWAKSEHLLDVFLHDFVNTRAIKNLKGSIDEKSWVKVELEGVQWVGAAKMKKKC